MKRVWFLWVIMLILGLLVACGEDWEETDFEAATEPEAAVEAVDSADDEAVSEDTDSLEAEDLPADEAVSEEALVFDDCPFDWDELEIDPDLVECAYLTVPEDWASPNGDGITIELPIAIIASESDSPLPDPIFFLEGGPGGSALSDIDSWAETPLRAEREIVLLDQRGTGYAIPSLNCPEMDADSDYEDNIAAAEACQERLADEGIDLSAYHSANNASDVNALRQALGYEEINLLGVSYGTRLALTIMRDHPQGLRSVVLDSVYPPNANAYTEQAVNIANAIDAMLIGCETDPDCNEWYPNLTEKYYDLLVELEADPYEPDDEIYLDDDAIIDYLGQALYQTEVIPALPYMIDEAYYGNYDPLIEVIYEDEGGWWSRQKQVRQDDVDVTDSEGMFHSVECVEEVHFADIETADDLMADYPNDLREKLVAEIEESIVICEIWDITPSSDLEAEAVVSDIPTLIVVGEYDPVTPPQWGRLAGETLSQHYYFEVPRGGHALLDAGECPLGLILEFLDDPTQSPDGSCLADAALPFE